MKGIEKINILMFKRVVNHVSFAMKGIEKINIIIFKREVNHVMVHDVDHICICN
jgi:hypothetical protein